MSRPLALGALALGLLCPLRSHAQSVPPSPQPAPVAKPSPAAAAKPSPAPAASSIAPAPLPVAAPAASPPGTSPARAPRRPASKAAAGPRPGLADSVWLRDGTRLRGTLLRVEPGNYVLLLGIEGVRTVPWRSVERIENAAEARATAADKTQPSVALLAPCCADELADQDARAPEDAWANVSLGWDLRGEGVSLFKRYTVGGRQVWYGGEGFGGGASVSMHFRGPVWQGLGGVRWSEFEFGIGDSLHSVVWKEGAEYQTKFLENQTSVILGGHFATGHFTNEGGRPPWSGLVVGIAWVPSYVRFFGSTDFNASGKFHPAGLRATLDWGRVAPGRKGRMPGLRAVFTWLPYVGRLPTAVSFGLGTVFF